MRKYLAAAIFAAFTVCTISIYYVQASLERLPQFRLETVSGDESEGNALVLRGAYRSGEYWESLKVDAAGSDYENEQSWSEQMNRSLYLHDPIIYRLIDKFPEFMRDYRSADYEDEEFVIRADWIPRFTVDRSTLTYAIHMDILDKSTKRTRKLKVSLSDTDTAIRGNVVQAGMFNRSNVLDVQRIGDVLKVAVYLEHSPDGWLITSVIRVYDIDWTSGQVIKTYDVEHDMKVGDNQEISVSVLKEHDWTLPHTSLALEIVLMNVEADNHINTNPAVLTRRLTTEKQQLMIYDYVSGHTHTIPLTLDDPEQGRDSSVYRIGDFAVQVKAQVDGSVNVSSYRLTDGAAMFDKHWSPGELQADEHISAGAAGPNRLYLLYKSGGTPVVTLVDPESGQFVYEGIMTVDGVEENKKLALLNNLNIYSVTTLHRQ